MIKFRTKIATITCAIVLAGCTPSIQTITHENISVTFGEKWNIITSDNPEVQKLDEGKKHSIVSIVNYPGNANITITKQPLSEEISSQKFAEQNITQSKNLPEYSKISTASARISGQKTKLHHFSAKLTEASTTIMQAYTVHGNEGYVATAILLNEEKDTILETKKVIKSMKFIADETQQ